MSTAVLPKHVWQPPTAEELLALLPQYEVTSLLGRGGMGAVYRGRQLSLDRPVAIKILSADLDESDMGFAERFKNEARAMAKLGHPGIVAVYDFGQTESGLLYIVMEFIEGTDVARMIAKKGRLHTDHAMAVTAHVCDALAYAHERGIIHRDIKPANIMVSYDGVVKVADFGLAKMTAGSEAAGLTQSGMAIGTLHYMAPEALILGTRVDQRADIYAMGVMLYQMLTGKLPQGLFEMPSLQVPGLDPRYDGIISKALREDRAMRYQSVTEMRHDLDSILTQPVVKVEADATQAPAALSTTARPQRTEEQAVSVVTQATLAIEKKFSPLFWAAVFMLTTFTAWLFLHRSKPEISDTSMIASSEPPPASKVSGSIAVPDSPVIESSQPKRLPPTVSAPVPPSSPTVEPSQPKRLPTTVSTSAPTRSAASPTSSDILTLPTWFDTKGRSLKADFKAIEGNNVMLNIAGKIQTVAMDTLSPASQKLAREYQQLTLASKEAPFTNSLGMKFVPVPGTKVLFCIHETRRQDYAAYAAEAPKVNGEWKYQHIKGIGCGDEDDHPICGVSWEDALAFIVWLSKKEGKSYRLPTDEEWSIAVGLSSLEQRTTDTTPALLSGKETNEFPWGGDYPPKSEYKAGNYCDIAYEEKFGPTPNMSRYTDGFPTTAPVMSFKPNKFGLYDLGGNVWEWCEDWFDNNQRSRVLRGGSWDDNVRGNLLSSRRLPSTPSNRHNHYGFRVVLEQR